MKHNFEQIHKDWVDGNIRFWYSSKQDHISSDGNIRFWYSSKLDHISDAPYIHIMLKQGDKYTTIRVLDNTARNICNLKRLVTNEIMYKLSDKHEKLVSIREVYSMITKGLVVDEYCKQTDYTQTGKSYCNIITYNEDGMKIEKYDSTGNAYHLINHYGWFKEHGARVEPYGLEIAQANFDFFMSLNWKNNIKRNLVKSDIFTLEQKFAVLKTMDVMISQCPYKSELLSQSVIYHPDKCDILEPTVYIYTYKCMADVGITKMYKHVLTVTADQFKSHWIGKPLDKGEKTQMNTKITLTHIRSLNGNCYSGDITELFKLYKKINTDNPFVYIEDEVYQFNETTLDYLVEKYKIPVDVETLKTCVYKGRLIQWCLKKRSFTNNELDSVIHYGRMIGAYTSAIKLLEDAKHPIKEQTIYDIYDGKVSDMQTAIDIINRTSNIKWTNLYWGLRISFGNNNIIQVLCSITKDVKSLANAIIDTDVFVKCCVYWCDRCLLTIADVVELIKDDHKCLIKFADSAIMSRSDYINLLNVVLKKGNNHNG